MRNYVSRVSNAPNLSCGQLVCCPGTGLGTQSHLDWPLQCAGPGAPPPESKSTPARVPRGIRYKQLNIYKSKEKRRRVENSKRQFTHGDAR